MPNVSKDDLVIIQDDKKRLLVRAIKSSDAGMRGYVADHTAHNPDTKRTLTFGPGDVVANLGPEPKIGKVYGVNVMPYLGSMDSAFGDILLFRRINANEEKRVRKVLRGAKKRVKRERLELDKEWSFEILTNISSKIGEYGHAPKDEKPDRLRIMPHDLSDLKELRYCFWHEYAHGLWFTRFTPAQQAAWVKAFLRNVAVSKATSEQLTRLRRDLVKEKVVRDFAKQLDEDDGVIFKEIMKWIKKNESILPRHINAMIDDGDDLAEIWPTKVDISKKTVLVSDYGTTAPDELWCDAFAFYMAQTETLPSTILTLMEKTLKQLKAGSSKGE